MSNCLYKFEEKFYTEDELKSLWDNYVNKERDKQLGIESLKERKLEIEDLLKQEVTENNIDNQIELEKQLEEIKKTIENSEDISEENSYEHQNEVKSNILDWINKDNSKMMGSLTGPPGVGKTYMIGQLTKDLLEQGKDVAIVSVTNDAVAQLKKATAKSLIRPTTLGSAFRQKYDVNTDSYIDSNEHSNLSDADVIIVDEGSMITQEELDKLMKFTNAKILFSSDPYQSTGQNEGLSPIYDLENIKKFELTQRIRQKEGSSIMELNDQLMEAIDGTINFNVQNVVEKYDEEFDGGVKLENDINDALDSFLDEYEEGKNTKVITFNNENNDNPLSVKDLTRMIYEKLEREPYIFLENDKVKFYSSVNNREGDVINNNQEAVVNEVETKEQLFNIGSEDDSIEVKMKVQVLTLTSKEGKYLGTVNVPLNKELFDKKLEELKEISQEKANLFKAEFADIHPDWVITVNRSQGATYESAYVIVDNILKKNVPVKAKNLRHMNVAVTRASNKTVIVSNRVNLENKDDNYKENPDFKIRENPITNDSLRKIGLKSNTDNNKQKEYISPAEAIIPSKFIDSRGNEVDLREKLPNGEYKYFYNTEDSEGNKFLAVRPEIVEDKLFDSIAYRVPTSAHNSMLSLKIVGFSDTSDQIIVNRNAMVPSGFDYDIDKETVFNLVQDVDKDGKLIVKKSNEINSENDLMDGEINNLHAMQKAVLDHVNTQHLTQKSLSFDRITQSSSAVSKTKSNTRSVNSLSTKLKYLSVGAGGKFGTGIHSIAVRVAHIVQGYNEANDDKIVYGQEQVQFGDFTKDGNTELSSLQPRISKSMEKMIDKITSVIDANSQNQNNSLDNANEGNMIKRNENSESIGFYVGFANAGLTDVQVNGKVYDYATLLLGNDHFYNQFITDDFEKYYKSRMRRYLDFIPKSKYIFMSVSELSELIPNNTIKGDTSFLTGDFLLNNYNEQTVRDNIDAILYELGKIHTIGKIVSSTGTYINGNFLEKNGTFDTWISKDKKAKYANLLPPQLKDYFSNIPNKEKERFLKYIINEIDEVTIRKQLKTFNKFNLGPDVFLSDVKAYMISSINSVLEGENIDDFRDRMTTQNKDHTSLIGYIESIKHHPSVIGNSMLNKFQNRQIQITNKNGKEENRYVIAYEKVSDLMPTVDEESQDFKLLYEKNKSLPDFNGKEYDTQQLAVDIFKYGLYVQGGVAGQASINRIIPKDLFFITGITNNLELAMNTLGSRNDTRIMSILKRISSQKSDKEFSPLYRTFHTRKNVKFHLDLNNLDEYIENVGTILMNDEKNRSDIILTEIERDKRTIKHLLEYYNKFIKTNKDNPITFYSSTVSKVNLDTNEIYLRDVYDTKQVIHELVHIITRNKINENVKVRQEIEALRVRLLNSNSITDEQRKLVATIIEQGGINDEIKKRKDSRLLYALTNIEEMLSVFFEKDPVFMKVLNNKDEYTGKTNTSKLMQIIRNVITSFARNIFGQTFNPGTYADNLASEYVKLTQKRVLDSIKQLDTDTAREEFSLINSYISGNKITVKELLSLLKDQNNIC